jgi:hypothetical protein
MQQFWNVEEFKTQLEQYFQPKEGNNRRLCSRNLHFSTDYNERIPKECVLKRGSILGVIHYWWLINEKIFDPTVFQFTSAMYDQATNIRDNMEDSAKNAFEFVKEQQIVLNLEVPLCWNYSYDALEEKYESVNDDLHNWYSNLR